MSMPGEKNYKGRGLKRCSMSGRARTPFCEGRKTWQLLGDPSYRQVLNVPVLHTCTLQSLHTHTHTHAGGRREPLKGDQTN